MSLRIPDELPARYPSHARPAGDVTCLGNAGGLSGATLWRYTAPSGECVCRAWPVAGPDRARLARIHAWLERCRSLAVIPAPIPDLDGRTFQILDGRLWEIAPWLPGAPDLAEPPGEEHVRAALGALARLHNTLGEDPARGRSPGLAHRVEELGALDRAGFQKIEAALAARSADALVPQAREWLATARETTPRVLPWLLDCRRLQVPLQPCLRDARPEHFLFRGKELTGLVDFGAMDVDTVAGDLARLLGEWLPGRAGLRAEALAAYRAIRPLDAAECALIAAFEGVADLLIGGHWIRWHFLQGRRFDDPQAVARGLGRGLSRLRRLAARQGFPGPAPGN
jgi:homoserine kinase type II